MAKPTLIQAVLERWNAIGGLPSLYLDEVPENYGSFLPIAVLIHDGEKPNYSTRNGPADTATLNGKPSQIIGRFQFEVYQAGTTVIGGMEAMETIVNAIMSGFLPGSLAMSNSQEAWLWREEYRANGTQLRDKNDVPVYKGTVTYVATIGNPTR